MNAIHSILGRRVCLDLDTGCRPSRQNWKKLATGTIVSAWQVRHATQLQQWRGKNPVVSIRVRLDDGREYDATDCDVFGWITANERTPEPPEVK